MVDATRSFDFSLHVALWYLRQSGERAGATGLGLYQVNGEVCRADEVIAYATALQACDAGAPEETPGEPPQENGDSR